MGVVNHLANMRGEAKLRSAIGVTKEQPQAMIGKAPDCEAYRGLFGWPGKLLSDIMAGLNDLVPTRDELAAVSRRNTKEALLHHDWVYRWNAIFRVVGIEPSPRIAARQRRLKDIAELSPAPIGKMLPQHGA